MMRTALTVLFVLLLTTVSSAQSTEKLEPALIKDSALPGTFTFEIKRSAHKDNALDSLTYKRLLVSLLEEALRADKNAPKVKSINIKIEIVYLEETTSLSQEDPFAPMMGEDLFGDEFDEEDDIFSDRRDPFSEKSQQESHPDDLFGEDPFAEKPDAQAKEDELIDDLFGEEPQTPEEADDLFGSDPGKEEDPASLFGEESQTPEISDDEDDLFGE